jgi:hypothetical protein
MAMMVNGSALAGGTAAAAVRARITKAIMYTRCCMMSSFATGSLGYEVSFSEQRLLHCSMRQAYKEREVKCNNPGSAL